MLVGLFDPAHLHHERLHAWFAEHRAEGWATCATTENGLVRVLSHPGYPGARTRVREAFELLRRFTDSGDHHFWAAAPSLRRASRVDTDQLVDHTQITGAHLLLLAVEHGGRLVTLDRDVPLGAVRSARADHLVRLA